ncbi:hypothetical protein [Actinomadura rudentiformis]|uniref:hypothetical protein n=1 Tax=Actinomadura rudentiformis TaxID=359158 RepID=UPI0038500717
MFVDLAYTSQMCADCGHTTNGTMSTAGAAVIRPGPPPETGTGQDAACTWQQVRDVAASSGLQP